MLRSRRCGSLSEMCRNSPEARPPRWSTGSLTDSSSRNVSEPFPATPSWRTMLAPAGEGGSSHRPEMREVQIKWELNFLKRLFSRYFEVNALLWGHFKRESWKRNVSGNRTCLHIRMSWRFCFKMPFLAVSQLSELPPIQELETLPDQTVQLPLLGLNEELRAGWIKTCVNGTFTG